MAYTLCFDADRFFLDHGKFLAAASDISSGKLQQVASQYTPDVRKIEYGLKRDLARPLSDISVVGPSFEANKLKSYIEEAVCLLTTGNLAQMNSADIWFCIMIAEQTPIDAGVREMLVYILQYMTTFQQLRWPGMQ